MRPIFITGIGTGVGKTLVSAIITEALQADYWKPVQAGYEDGTDALTVRNLISNRYSEVFAEAYKLQMPASPHIAARHQNIEIKLEEIKNHFDSLQNNNDFMVIEGAGGVMVPLSNNVFVYDLVKTLDAEVILVSRNYLGSINHSLATASVCRALGLKVRGWIFTDDYLDYAGEIAQWSGYPIVGAIPLLPAIDRQTVAEQAQKLRFNLLNALAT